MAAIVIINRLTGTSPGVKTDIAGINTRVNADDTHTTAGIVNPVTIPTSGTKRSFWAHTQLEVVSGLGGIIDNIRWFISGSLDTGIVLNGEAATAYVQATGTVGDSGDELNVVNHPSLIGAPSDLTVFTSGSPKLISGSTSGSGSFGNFLVYQFDVDNTAQPGVISPLAMTWKYDET